MSRNLSQSQPGSSSPQRRKTAPPRVRRAAAATGVLLAAALAAGCAAGFDATTQQIKPNAGSGQAGPVKVDNVWLIVDPASGNAEVVGAVTNTGTDADTLTGVTATNAAAKLTGTDAATATTGITVGAGTVAIPGGESVSFGETGNPQLELAGVDFQAGVLAQVTFTFAQAGAVTVTAQVEPDSGLFAEYNPNSGIPTPTPTPTAPTTAATPTAPASATGSATGTATGAASATPTVTKTQ
ncbi:MAG TPA: hypothetical protein VGX23_37425 [Actinocrinis sp.]|nr:hypothetical protein [Actinocrinis sp.]